MRTVLALAAAASVAVAIATPAAGDGGPSPGVAMGWTGVTAPGGATRWVTMGGSRDTVVAQISTRSGRVERYGVVRGIVGVPLVAWDGTTSGLLPDGRTLVLAAPIFGANHSASRFLLYDLKRLRVRDEIVLRGACSFDAISPSGRTLYLIEHVRPAKDPTRYRVRAYDLPSRRLLAGAIRDRRNRHTTMNGWPYSRATSGDGVWAYTLYGGGQYAFVHALNTARREAVCIALPWPGRAAKLVGLRMTRRGSRLLVRMPKGGEAATIDLTSFRVTKARRLT